VISGSLTVYLEQCGPSIAIIFTAKRNSTCLILKNRLKVIDEDSQLLPAHRQRDAVKLLCGELIMARRRNLESAQPRPRTINNHISLLVYNTYTQAIALSGVEIEDRNATLGN